MMRDVSIVVTIHKRIVEETLRDGAGDVAFHKETVLSLPRRVLIRDYAS